VIVQPAQDPGAGATYPDQDQRHKDGDLENLQCKSARRKPGRVDRDANPEDEQRQSIRNQSGPDHDDDRLQPEDAKARDDRQSEQRMRCEQRADDDRGDHRMTEGQPVRGAEHLRYNHRDDTECDAAGLRLPKKFELDFKTRREHQ